MRYDSRRYALVNRWDSRHESTVRALLDPQPGERVLEVGAGRGHLTKRLRSWGADAVGIDANPQAPAVAVTDSVLHMRGEALAFDDNSFDKLVSVHAIEHIPDLADAFGEMARVLRPGGRALYVYPAEPVKGLFAVPTAMILYRNPFKATSVHCQWLWPRRVRAIAEPQGFRHVQSQFKMFSTPQFVTLFELV